MRRLLAIAAFLLAFSVVPVCVYAQRGGGHGGGGFSGGAGHGGFSGGHAGFAGHSGFSSESGFSGSHISSFSGSHYGSGSHSYGYYNGNRGQRYYYGYRGRGPYVYSYYGYPYYGWYGPSWDAWWWDNGPSSYDEDAMSQRELANEMNQQNLEEQDMLRRQDRDYQDQDLYSQRSRQAQPVADSRPENDPATVLVFRDQQQREIHNYAIADGILYNFTTSRTEKIPLVILDIPATIKANDDRGVEFHLPPPPSEGQ